MRPEVASFGLGDFMAGLVLGFIFVVTYFSLMALVARRQAQAALLFVTSKMLPRKEANA